MASRREQVVAAVEARCASLPLVKVERNRDRPTKVPPEGLLIVRDGEVGEPEVLLSPISYVWTHQVRIEVYTSSGNLDGHMDDLLIAIGTALSADTTLGGLVDYMRAGAPDFDGADPEGASSLKSAVVTVTLTYETTDPLA